MVAAQVDQGNRAATLKTKPLQPSDLDRFVGLTKPGAMGERQPT
ncbi:MAG: hypothetical protein VKN15_01670 [Cyanobacteriota bacterium]|nr:hypothetical protein [Cyanobacteriota bacterium]